MERINDRQSTERSRRIGDFEAIFAGGWLLAIAFLAVGLSEAAMLTVVWLVVVTIGAIVVAIIETAPGGSREHEASSPRRPLMAPVAAVDQRAPLPELQPEFQTEGYNGNMGIEIFLAVLLAVMIFGGLAFAAVGGAGKRTGTGTEGAVQDPSDGARPEHHAVADRSQSEHPGAPPS
jgi:hypothetical protein